MKRINNLFIFIFILLACFVLSSCSDDQQPCKKTGPFTTLAERTDAFYELYVYEKEICPAFARAISEDADLLSRLVNPDVRRTEGINSLLAKSSVADNDSVKYVINNSRYFTVDVDYHGGAGYVYAKTAPVFCVQTDRRLKELEAIGASYKAWEVREYFLNQMLTDALAIGMPGYEGPVGFDFRAIIEEFDSAKRTYYAPDYRQRLLSWANRAATLLRERLKTLKPGESELTKAQQAYQVEKWITELKRRL
jgi:hypothetical protein